MRRDARASRRSRRGEPYRRPAAMRENSSPSRSTMRCSGASVTRRFVPLPMRSGFSPASASRAQTVSTSETEDGSSIASHGPPMRNEQWRLIGSFSRIVSSGQRERASRRKERSSAFLIPRPPSGRGAPRAPARRCSPFCARGCSLPQARGSPQDFCPAAPARQSTGSSRRGSP